MEKNLPINKDQKFKYSITFQSTNEESRELGDFSKKGFVVEDELAEIGDILYKANTDYGIYYPLSFGVWESTSPDENKDYYEKGIHTYYSLHITNEDGTEISQEQNDFITFLLSDGRYNASAFESYAVGGIVLGSIALGVGALITYFYFNNKKGSESESEDSRAKSVTHKINGKERKFPIKDAWRKEHNIENKNEKHEVPQENRKTFKSGGEIISSELNKGYQYTYEIDDNNNGSLYKEGGVYFVKGFENGNHFSEVFEKFLDAKKYYLSKQEENKAYADGGDLGYSKKDYFLVVQNWVYFTFNYPHNFVKDAFNSNHLEEKFNSLYNKYGSVSVLMSLWMQLDSNNRDILAIWIKNNYFNSESNKEELLSVSDSNYSEILKHWNLFCFNYPYNFVEKVFNNNDHFEEKFVRAYERAGSVGAVNKFFTELSYNNQELLTDWVYDNYSPNKYAGGGNVSLKIKDWYTKNYPTDDLGEEINDVNTFEDLWNGIHNNKNVYHIIGIGDSVIRERLFEYLSEIKEVEYNYIYNKWLESSDDEYAGGGTINKKYNFPNLGVASFKDLIKNGEFVSKFKSIENAVKYSRNKFNRMNYAEQKEYYDKINKQKTIYNLRLRDNSFYAVSKEIYDYAKDLPEEEEQNLFIKYYADGGRVTSNEGIIESFLTSNKELKVGNLSTHYNEYDGEVLLRNYGTLIATRKENEVSITNTKYSITTTKITNKVRNMAINKKMNVNHVDKFEDGGGVDDYSLKEYIEFTTSGEDSYLSGNIGGDKLDLIDVENIGNNKYSAIVKSHSIAFEGLKGQDLEDEIYNQINEMFATNSDINVNLESIYLNKFKDGGEAGLDYSNIYNVLKSKIEDAIDDLPNKYENSYTFKGEEVEHESRDGFIPYTDGGYGATWFEYMSSFNSSGYNLPTKPLNDEMNRQVDYNLKLAKDNFIKKYPEIVEEIGEENINYNSLYEAGYGDEAEELSSEESDNMSDDSIMMQITAFYYSPENDRGIDGKHTIKLFCDVNLESPYHRAGNLDDGITIEFTFDSIEELATQMDSGLKKIISWFNGEMYDDSTAEMKIRRMEKGGDANDDDDDDDDDDEYAGGGSVFEKFMLEWEVFENGKFIESNTTIAKSLKEINDFIEQNNLSIKDNDYTIKGFKNRKWETLVSKYAEGGLIDVNDEKLVSLIKQENNIILEKIKRVDEKMLGNYLLDDVNFEINAKNSISTSYLNNLPVYKYQEKVIPKTSSSDAYILFTEHKNMFFGVKRKYFLILTIGNNYPIYITKLINFNSDSKIEGKYQIPLEKRLSLIISLILEKLPQDRIFNKKEVINYLNENLKGFVYKVYGISNFYETPKSVQDYINKLIDRIVESSSSPEKIEDSINKIITTNTSKLYLNQDYSYNLKESEKLVVNSILKKLEGFKINSITDLSEKNQRIIKNFANKMYEYNSSINWVELTQGMFDKGGSADEEDEYAGGGSVFEKFMLEWKVFENGKFIESNTTIAKSLKEINDFIEQNNLSIKDNDYTIKGFKNRKWETLVSKYAGGGSVDDILSLYKKDKFSENDSELIEEAIENGDIDTDDIKEDFMSYAYDKIGDKYESEEISEYTDEQYENGLTHKENYDNLIEFLESEDDEYAGGGSVDEEDLEDWMHEAIESLREETGFDDLEITMVSNSENEFYASNGDAEYRVFKDKDSAFLVAEDEVRDDMEESPENFNQNFIVGYIDGRNFFESEIKTSYKSYAEGIKSETDELYANRLIKEMVENGILDEDDALSDEGKELAEERIDDFVELLTEEALNQGNDGLDYLISNYGKEYTMKLVVDNNLIDIFRASKDAVNIDGIAHFLSSYDGETLYLSNDNVAYRTN